MTEAFCSRRKKHRSGQSSILSVLRQQVNRSEGRLLQLAIRAFIALPLNLTLNFHHRRSFNKSRIYFVSSLPEREERMSFGPLGEKEPSFAQRESEGGGCGQSLEGGRLRRGEAGVYRGVNSPQASKHYGTGMRGTLAGQLGSEMWNEKCDCKSFCLVELQRGLRLFFGQCSNVARHRKKAFWCSSMVVRHVFLSKTSFQIAIIPTFELVFGKNRSFEGTKIIIGLKANIPLDVKICTSVYLPYFKYSWPN